MAEGDEGTGTSGGTTTRTVFVSYASHDTEVANTVCQFLEHRLLRQYRYVDISIVGAHILHRRALSIALSAWRRRASGRSARHISDNIGIIETPAVRG